MTLSMLIPIGLLLMIIGGVLFAVKKQPKVAAVLLGIGALLIIGTVVMIGLMTSSM